MNVFINIDDINIDLTRNLSPVMEITVRDTLGQIQNKWRSSQTNSESSLLFTKSNTEFSGTLELKDGWNSHKQGNQLYNHIPSRQPVSHLNKQNSMPQWGRISSPTPKANIDKSPSANNPMDLYFTSSSVNRGKSAIQDTFLDVFKGNSKYIMGQKGGL